MRSKKWLMLKIKRMPDVFRESHPRPDIEGLSVFLAVSRSNPSVTPIALLAPRSGILQRRARRAARKELTIT